MSWLDQYLQLGTAGNPGAPGPAAAAVANPAALTALSTAAIIPFATTIGVTSLPSSPLFYWNPASVATPDGQNIIAASSTGNWINAFGQNNILGETIVSGLDIAGESAVSGVGVGGGATQAINLRFNPSGGTTLFQLSAGEEVEVFAVIKVKSAVFTSVSSATGSGVQVVLTVASAVGFVTGSVVFVSGVLGNTAANTRAYVTVSGSTLTLWSDSAMSVPINGNGTYTSGGSVLSQDFVTIKRGASLREIHGIVINPQSTVVNGSPADYDLTTPPPPGNSSASLTSLTAAIVWQANTVQVSVAAPVGTPVTVSVQCSYMRSPTPGLGHIPIVPLGGLSTTSGSSNGGTTITITGGQYFTGTVAVTVAGVPASFDPVTNDTVLVIHTSAGLPLGGSGDINVTNGGGTGSTGSSTAFTYLADPNSIGIATGTDIRVAWWPNTNIQQSAGVCTSWTDATGKGQTLTATGSPTYNASSSSITPHGPSASLNGTSQGFLRATLAIAASTGSNVFWWAVVRVTSSALNPSVLNYTSNVQIELDVLSTGHPAMSGQNGTFANFPSDIRGTTVLLYGYTDGASGAGSTSFCNVNNSGSPATASGTSGGTTPTSTTFGFGCRGNSTDFMPGELVDGGILNAAPTTGQKNALDAWSLRVYGVG